MGRCAFIGLVLLLALAAELHAQTEVARVRQRIAQIRGQATAKPVILPLIVSQGAAADNELLLRRIADLERLLLQGLAHDVSRPAAPLVVVGSRDSLDISRLALLLDSLIAMPPTSSPGWSRSDLVAVLDSLLSVRLSASSQIPVQEPVITVVERALLETGLFRAASVIFEFDRSTLLPASFSTLHAVGEVLAKYPDLHIEVGGHTDNVGSEAYNRELSATRAEAVRAYLLQHFPLLTSERITAQGYGESRPVADNLSETGRALNRRVEFAVRRVP